MFFREMRVVRLNKMSQEDTIIIGSGIVGSSAATLLSRHSNVTIVDPNIAKNEADRDGCSNPENNSGTGHGGYAELNYVLEEGTPFKVQQNYTRSMALYMALRENSIDGITQVPHMSRHSNHEFLKNRQEAMQPHHFFNDMQYSHDREKIKEWSPLMAADKENNPAFTYFKNGTDMDFGKIANGLLGSVEGDIETIADSVRKITKGTRKKWNVIFSNGDEKECDNLLIAAGGETLRLLHDIGVKSAKGYAAFPVAGQFLVADVDDLPEGTPAHDVKCYGEGKKSEPMSIPHLDFRLIGGRKKHMFGPFPEASYSFFNGEAGHDHSFPLTVARSPAAYIAAPFRNFGLTKYLIKEVLTSNDDKKRAALLKFAPALGDAIENYTVETAGQRVQTLTPWGESEFGTKVFADQERRVGGASTPSPGGTNGVLLALQMIEETLPHIYEDVKRSIQILLPDFFEDLVNNKKAHSSLISPFHEALNS